MTLSMTNSEEIDGLNNRKFTGLFGLWSFNKKEVASMQLMKECLLFLLKGEYPAILVKSFYNV